jgi:hypothetical protein
MLQLYYVSPLNAELNPICHLLALLETHRILHISRISVKIILCYNYIMLQLYNVTIILCYNYIMLQLYYVTIIFST